MNNLHFNTEYSFFESPTKVKDYVENARKLGLNQLVITDHNNVHGYGEFRKYCYINNIKPIFGIDLDVEEGRVILLAKNNSGFLEIKELSFKKSKEEKIFIDDISDKNLFIINHPIFGIEKPEQLLSKFNDFYFYEQNNSKTNVFIKDARIINNESYPSLEIISKLKESKLDNKNNYVFGLLNENVDQKLIDTIDNILNNCNVIFDEKQNMLPTFCDNPLDYLKDEIKIKINIRKDLLNFNQEIVKERLKYELSVIEKMNVENYFLIISDLIN